MRAQRLAVAPEARSTSSARRTRPSPAGSRRVRRKCAISASSSASVKLRVGSSGAPRRSRRSARAGVEDRAAVEHRAQPGLPAHEAHGVAAHAAHAARVEQARRAVEIVHHVRPVLGRDLDHGTRVGVALDHVDAARTRQVGEGLALGQPEGEAAERARGRPRRRARRGPRPGGAAARARWKSSKSSSGKAALMRVLRRRIGDRPILRLPGYAARARWG